MDEADSPFDGMMKKSSKPNIAIQLNTINRQIAEDQQTTAILLVAAPGKEKPLRVCKRSSALLTGKILLRE